MAIGVGSVCVWGGGVGGGGREGKRAGNETTVALRLVFQVFSLMCAISRYDVKISLLTVLYFFINYGHIVF